MKLDANEQLIIRVLERFWLFLNYTVSHACSHDHSSEIHCRNHEWEMKAKPDKEQIWNWTETEERKKENTLQIEQFVWQLVSFLSDLKSPHHEQGSNCNV